MKNYKQLLHLRFDFFPKVIKSLVLILLCLWTMDSVLAHGWEVRVNANPNNTLTWFVQSYHSLGCGIANSGLTINGTNYPFDSEHSGSCEGLSPNVFMECGPDLRASYAVVTTPYLAGVLVVNTYSDNACWEAYCGNGSGTAPPPPCTPEIICRNQNIMLGGPNVILNGLQPPPQMLPAQLKGIGGPCSNVPATPDVMCNCPTGYVAIGYQADYGNGWGSGVISKFRLKCKEVMADGMFGPNEVWTCYNGTAAGSTTDISEMTAPGHALVGFQNRMGCAIDRITGRSKSIDEILAMGSNASNTVMSGVGGAGGGLQALQLVPDGYVIIGMQTYIDPVAPNTGVSGGYAWKYAKLEDVMRACITVTDDCGGIASVSLSKSSFNCMDEGTTVVTATVTSTNGSVATCNFNVIANGPPSIGACPISPTVYNGLGRISTFSSINLAGTNTNVAHVNPGQAINISFTRNTVRPPGAPCPGCITQHYVGLNDGTSTLFSSCLFSTTGNSSGNHSINFNAPAAPGVYYLNLTATWWFFCYQFGTPPFPRTSSNPLAVLIVGCGQTECPEDITVTTPNGICEMAVNYNSLCAYDKSAGASLNQTKGLAPGSVFPVGKTKNTYVATDANGKKTTCSFDVTVLAGKCEQPIQVYHIDTTENSAKIRWKAKGVGHCNTNYQLRIRKELSPGVWGSWSSWDNYSEDPTLEHHFTGLTSSSYYHYQIRSKCGTTNSTVVNGWFFTLGAAPLKKSDKDITEDLFVYDKVDQKRNSGENSIVQILAIPNPASEFCTLQMQGFDKQSKTVTMLDLFGKMVFRLKLPASENNPELDLRKLNVQNGAYLFHVDDGQNRKTVQLIIQR